MILVGNNIFPKLGMLTNNTAASYHWDMMNYQDSVASTAFEILPDNMILYCTVHQYQLKTMYMKVLRYLSGWSCNTLPHSHHKLNFAAKSNHRKKTVRHQCCSLSQRVRNQRAENLNKRTHFQEPVNNPLIKQIHRQQNMAPNGDTWSIQLSSLITSTCHIALL